MSVQIKALTRVFKHGSLSLPDPGAQFSPEQVRDLFCATYTELTNAVVEGPKTTARGLEYEFVVPVGTKGAAEVSTAAANLLGAGDGATSRLTS
jgi:PRTRC genetic system protein C